jgi:hypothetical protein
MSTCTMYSHGITGVSKPTCLVMDTNRRAIDKKCQYVRMYYSHNYWSYFASQPRTQTDAL